MYKNVEMPACAALWFIEQTGTGLLELSDRAKKIGHAECDVVQTFAALGQEFANNGVVFGGFEELDARTGDGEHRDIYFFMRDGFPGGHAEAELPLIELERLVERADSDAEMVDTKCV